MVVKKRRKSSKKTTVSKVVGVAKAAGSYFLYGKGATKHRKEALKVADKVKKDILGGLKMIKKMDKKSYHSLVDKRVKKYEKVIGMETKDLKKIANEMKKHWSVLEKNFKKTKKITVGKKKIVRKKKK